MTVISKRICVEPEYLDTNIVQHIYNKIKKNILDENSVENCTEKYGYILDVKKIISIEDNYISNVNCENVFTVVFEVDNLKPENGKQFTGKICMIYTGGIFLIIKNKQKVLIPFSTLKDYIFDSSNKCFKKGKKIINIGDVIDVIITGTKYNNKTFSCFGTLVEN